MVVLLALASLAAWIYLAFFRGGFWRADQRLKPAPAPAEWPRVTAVIPARDEAASITKVIAAHTSADYPGAFSIFLVDDQSEDGTASLAHEAAGENIAHLTVIEGAPLPEGWTGKLWAAHQGLKAAEAKAPDYILLTDADIILAPETLTRLIAKAEHENLALASLMARLDARGFWGGLLIPAFIYFFQKLYPFPLSNDANENIAAAAGGCMLVRRDALNAAGGAAAIRNTLIDDCALARRIKDLSPTTKTWVGLAEDEAKSLRDNRSLSSIWNMVARTAYAQLWFSPLALLGTLAGMALIYLTPPVIALSFALHGDGFATGLALLAWGIMAYTYWPTLKLYGQQPWQAATLPLAALLYSAMTFDSARREFQGRGGQWKGRHYQLGKKS